MTIFYILLASVCIYMELSTKVNTDNLINKIGLTLIIIGALLHLAQRPNHLIEIGTFLHFICEIKYGYKRNRRINDRKPI